MEHLNEMRFNLTLKNKGDKNHMSKDMFKGQWGKRQGNDQ